MENEDQWNWIGVIRRLAAIADAGLFYTKDVYDKERYKELQSLTATLLSQVMEQPLEGILRQMKNNIGYLTPKIDVRGVAFKGDKILLVKERGDGKWCLPGGWGDIGETPSETVEKEVREEAGFIVKAAKLLAVFDGNRRSAPLEAYHAYKLFFLCVIEGESPNEAFIETEERGFFGIDEIPPLSEERTSALHLKECFAHLHDSFREAYFD